MMPVGPLQNTAKPERDSFDCEEDFHRQTRPRGNRFGGAQAAAILAQIHKVSFLRRAVSYEKNDRIFVNGVAQIGSALRPPSRKLSPVFQYFHGVLRSIVERRSVPVSKLPWLNGQGIRDFAAHQAIVTIHIAGCAQRLVV